ncbi:hypothetical protein [Nonomuraea indica]|uniref:DUF4177 domain-containing protein n=1 Tax=Nonomuraea indica TaxID=1581193 RepID=A0ABW7ZXX2_9ACTN|nr:hypothetical protein [Nonomuraea indica]
MGIFKQTTNDVLATSARTAAAEGRTVFTAQIISEIGHVNFSGEIEKLGRGIEAVEAEGWRLDTVNTLKVDKMTGDRPLFVCVFRRHQW